MISGVATGGQAVDRGVATILYLLRPQGHPLPVYRELSCSRE